MITAKVGGVWLGSIGAHGPFTVEYGPHGFDSASWQMDEDLRHPLLRGNIAVDVFDGGLRIGSCKMVEPTTAGQFSALGIYHQAERNYALGQLEGMTSNPYDAVQWAINRGDISWSAVDPSVPYADWGNPSEPMMISDLLDAVAAEYAMRWYVSASDKTAYMEADPVVPQWVVPHAVAGRGLTPAEDEFYTHLTGRYLNSTGAFVSTTLGSQEAQDAFGRRVKLVDLSDLGSTTQSRANQVLSGMLLKSGARMGWGEGLELGYGQITTPGGTPAPLNQIRSRQMVRLAGTIDTSRPARVRAYTDIVLDRVRYTDGAQTISLTPFGYAARNFDEVLELALSESRG